MCHLIVSFSSPYFSACLFPNSNRQTHKNTARMGGERILKTNKQRIDLLRRITEVLITSDPSPLLSKSAALISLVLYSINVSTLIIPISLLLPAQVFVIDFKCFLSNQGKIRIAETDLPNTIVAKSLYLTSNVINLAESLCTFHRLNKKKGKEAREHTREKWLSFFIYQD